MNSAPDSDRQLGVATEYSNDNRVAFHGEFKNRAKNKRVADKRGRSW